MFFALYRKSSMTVFSPVLFCHQRSSLLKFLRICHSPGCRLLSSSSSDAWSEWQQAQPWWEVSFLWNLWISKALGNVMPHRQWDLMPLNLISFIFYSSFNCMCKNLSYFLDFLVSHRKLFTEKQSNSQKFISYLAIHFYEPPTVQNPWFI